jgi:adenine/guanine/hypoxanthine permease
LFIAPFLGVIPAAATAPALILVGALMMAHAGEIDWTDLRNAVPAFLTIISIPLTFSIANGLGLGFLSYALLQLLTGRARTVSPFVYVLSAILLLRFLYLGSG